MHGPSTNPHPFKNFRNTLKEKNIKMKAKLANFDRNEILLLCLPEFFYTEDACKCRNMGGKVLNPSTHLEIIIMFSRSKKCSPLRHGGKYGTAISFQQESRNWTF